ncbi:MAG: hypothetical protein IKY34_05720 [Ruminiclostridium sp.]|nr:hypothetical protein [Ruminiclostridium sp.]
MITRQLSQRQYDAFCKDLAAYAYSPPLFPYYILPLRINGKEYNIWLQPDAHCKIAVLYAVDVLREEDGVSHILITQNALLASFLEILLAQGIRPV